MTWLPSPDQVLSSHGELAEAFADDQDPISPPGLKSYDMLASACVRPLIAIGEIEKYPNTLDKCAALFHSLTKNHAFHNGNKRIALLILLYTLKQNGYELDWSVSDSEIYGLVKAVTADAFPCDGHGLSPDQVLIHLSSWLRGKTVRVPPRLSVMAVDEFASRCQAAGALVRLRKGGAVLIRVGSESITISGSTRRLTGQVVLRYLSKLRLGLTAIGLSPFEFQGGFSTERQLIHRYLTVFRRLART